MRELFGFISSLNNRHFELAMRHATADVAYRNREGKEVHGREAVAQALAERTDGFYLIDWGFHVTEETGDTITTVGTHRFYRVNEPVHEEHVRNVFRFRDDKIAGWEEARISEEAARPTAARG